MVCNYSGKDLLNNLEFGLCSDKYEPTIRLIGKPNPIIKMNWDDDRYLKSLMTLLIKNDDFIGCKCMDISESLVKDVSSVSVSGGSNSPVRTDGNLTRLPLSADRALYMVSSRYYRLQNSKREVFSVQCSYSDSYNLHVDTQTLRLASR